VTARLLEQSAHGSPDGCLLAVALLVIAAAWLWAFRDFCSDPRRPAALRWYHQPCAPDLQERRWDLAELNRCFPPEDAPRHAGFDDGELEKRWRPG
jgi:hypothetical protein